MWPRTCIHKKVKRTNYYEKYSYLTLRVGWGKRPPWNKNQMPGASAHFEMLFLTSLSISVLFAYTQMFNSRSPDLFYRNQTESRVLTCIIATHSYARFSWWVFCLQPSQIRYKSMQSVDGDSSQPICTKITLKKRSTKRVISYCYDE